MEKETKRTIQEILDVETGNIIKASDFFKKSEAEIVAYRRLLAEAIKGYTPPKFRCLYCNQLLKLSGRADARGEISFFAHYYDSDECEIKTNNNLSKEEIEAKKYANVSESNRHKELKQFIFDHLSTTDGVANVALEKRITSEDPYLFWRRPDVYAEYKGHPLVFELQLSTTFLSVIIDRDIFYRANKIFIIWVFNFSDNKEYVSLESLMCKDIFYANKRNAFILDDEAKRLTLETGELNLLCVWFEPLIQGDVHQKGQMKKCEKYVKLSDLKFEIETFKPYYVDADALFAHDEPNYFKSRVDLENAHKLRLERLAQRRAALESRIQQQIDLIEDKKIELRAGGGFLVPFKKNGKWGFELDGVEIVKPRYSEISEFSKEGYALVKFNKKWGFINQFGDVVVDTAFDKLWLPIQGVYYGKYWKKWYKINLEDHSMLDLQCDDLIPFGSSDLLIARIDKRYGRIEMYPFLRDQVEISKYVVNSVYGSITDGFDDLIEKYYYIEDEANRQHSLSKEDYEQLLQTYSLEWTQIFMDKNHNIIKVQLPPFSRRRRRKV